jgi:hypothetical protein
MRLRRLAALQWLGLVLGGVVWFAGHIVGFGITEAECGRAGSAWGISNDVWQASLTAAAGALVLAAELAAVAVLVGTRGTSYEAEPPVSRMRFFAIAAATANALFLVIVLLDGLGAILSVTCRGG